MPRKRKLSLSEFTATVFLPLERFSIEFSEAKIKEIKKANQNKEKTLKSHRELRVKSTKLPKARENAGDQAAIGLSFAFDWFREWRGFSGPITERSKTKSIRCRLAFDTQLKIALSQIFFHFPTDVAKQFLLKLKTFCSCTQIKKLVLICVFSFRQNTSSLSVELIHSVIGLLHTPGTSSII